MKNYRLLILLVLLLSVPFNVLGAVPNELPLDDGIVIDVSGSDVDSNVVPADVIEPDNNVVSGDGSVLPLDQTNLTDLDSGTEEVVNAPAVRETPEVQQVTTTTVEQPLPKTGIEDSTMYLVLSLLIIATGTYLYTRKKAM